MEDKKKAKRFLTQFPIIALIPVAILTQTSAFFIEAEAMLANIFRSKHMFIINKADHTTLNVLHLESS